MENQTQNNNPGQQTITIQVPSAENIANRRPLIPVLFIIAFVFFFFNFFTFSCGDQKIRSIKGIELVTGTEIKNQDLFTGEETKGEKIPSNIWAIIAFGAAIIGFGAYLIKEKNEDLIGTGAGFIGAGAMFMLQFAVKSVIEEKSEGISIETEIHFAYWGALIALGIAGFICYLRMKNVQKGVSQNPNTISPQELHNEIINEPISKDIRPNNSFDFVKWIKANFKIFVSILGAFIVLLSVYYLFIKPNPSKDGKKASNLICDCQEKHTADNLIAYEKFLNEFTSYNFKTKSDAILKFNEIIGSETQKFNQCLDNISIKKNELRRKYLIDEKKLSIFDATFNEHLCNIPENEKVDNLNSQIQSKIKEIKEPEPDINKIKNDLIGRILGNTNWRFAYLSEIKNITIKDKVLGTNNLEYIIELDLVDYKTQESYYAKAILKYTLESLSGWSLQDIVATEYLKEGKIPKIENRISSTNSISDSNIGKYPQASQRLLTINDLKGLSKQDLKIMRNEIFARHGYIFKSQDMKTHFENLPWYHADKSDVSVLLSTIEKKNIEFIKKYE